MLNSRATTPIATAVVLAKCRKGRSDLPPHWISFPGAMVESALRDGLRIVCSFEPVWRLGQRATPRPAPFYPRFDLMPAAGRFVGVARTSIKIGWAVETEVGP